MDDFNIDLCTCPRCGVLDRPTINPDSGPPGAQLSDSVAHALIDHLLLVESELAAIRRLLMEEVGL
jgi:hypothetical protein